MKETVDNLLNKCIATKTAYLFFLKKLRMLLKTATQTTIITGNESHKMTHYNADDGQLMGKDLASHF